MTAPFMLAVLKIPMLLIAGTPPRLLERALGIPAPEPTDFVIVPVVPPSPEPLHAVHNASPSLLLLVGVAGAILAIAFVFLIFRALHGMARLRERRRRADDTPDVAWPTARSPLQDQRRR